MKDKDRLIIILAITALFSVLMSIYLCIDIGVTNNKCIEAVEGRFDNVVDYKMEIYCRKYVDEQIDDKIDEYVQEYIEQMYDLEIVKQDGQGVNIYQSGSGTISVPERSE